MVVPQTHNLYGPGSTPGAGTKYKENMEQYSSILGQRIDAFT